MGSFDWIIQHEARLERLQALRKTGRIQYSAKGITISATEVGLDVMRHMLVAEAAMAFAIFGPMGLGERMAGGVGLRHKSVEKLTIQLNQFVGLVQLPEITLRPFDLRAMRDCMVYLRDVYRIEREFQTVTSHEMAEYHAALAVVEQWSALVESSSQTYSTWL